MRATTLTDGDLAELRDRAGREATGFIDPARLNRVEHFISGRCAWAQAVTGRPSFTSRTMTERELALLDLAAEAEPQPPTPAPKPVKASPRESAWEARQLAAAREWETLRAALPVPVIVAYNYSGPHHYEFHTSGADHILVQGPVDVGRLHRTAGQALCETPSRARHLLFDSTTTQDSVSRVPTCKACLRVAGRIAEAVSQ